MGYVRHLATSAGFLIAAACGGGDLVLPGDGAPAAITPVVGDGQTGTVGSPLADAIVVRVTDETGRAMAGVSLEFAVAPAGAGSVDPGTAVTDADGEAGASWTLGQQAGPQAVDVRVVGADQVAARLTATAEAGPAASIAALSGDGQSAPVGTALGDSLVVRVTDAYGNPVSGAPVRWTADQGSVAPDQVDTDDEGRAAALRVLGNEAGTQTAAASSPTLNGSPVIFTQMGTAGTAARLLPVSGDGQSAAPGAELPDPLVVRLVDAQGNPVPGRPVTWVVGAGGGSVSAVTDDTDADGLATTRWTLGPAAGTTNTLNAVVSGVEIVTFTATATGDGGGGGGGGGSGADHLVFQVQPSNAIEKERISPAVTVAVVDQNGAPVSEPNMKIRLELVAGSGRLQGKLERDTKNGIAVFDDLKIDEPGDGKVLRATARDHAELGAVESQAFSIEKRD